MDNKCHVDLALYMIKLLYKLFLHCPTKTICQIGKKYQYNEWKEQVKTINQSPTRKFDICSKIY